MCKGYWIARVDVSDPEQYSDYVAANQKAFGAFDARFIVRGGPFESPEGTARERNIVIEFPSIEAAQACYESPEYERAKKLREGACIVDLVIIEGYDDPKSQ